MSRASFRIPIRPLKILCSIVPSRLPSRSRKTIARVDPLPPPLLPRTCVAFRRSKHRATLSPSSLSLSIICLVMEFEQPLRIDFFANQIRRFEKYLDGPRQGRASRDPVYFPAGIFSRKNKRREKEKKKRRRKK